MTDAQARYSATLRKWASYARALAEGDHVEVNAAELAAAIDFNTGDFARLDFEEYKMFRGDLDNRPERLKALDGLRRQTRAAWDAAQMFGMDAERALRLADALDVEAEYVKDTGLSEAGCEGKSTDREATPDLLKDLAPESKKGDAIQYCARLVCHVWNTGEHGGKRKSADYVFVKAKEGESLSGDCRYARRLVEKWGISTGGIMTKAATIHALQSGGKHIKADGMERPETMREAARKSREAERSEMERKAEHGARRSGKKR